MPLFIESSSPSAIPFPSATVVRRYELYVTYCSPSSKIWNVCNRERRVDLILFLPVCLHHSPMHSVVSGVIVILNFGYIWGSYSCPYILFYKEREVLSLSNQMYANECSD